MKAVILCAGKATRCYPLTLTRPKPLLTVANKSLLQHALEQLGALKEITEVVLVVGYKKEMIQEWVEKNKHHFPFTISFVEQKEQKGTGHAMACVRQKIYEPFLLLHGDDLYFADDMKKLLKHVCAFLVKKVSQPDQFGIVVSEQKKGKTILTKIIEKPKEFVGDLANIGCYKLDPSIFSLTIKPSHRGEVEIVDYLTAWAQQHDVVCVEAAQWVPIPFAWSLLDANKYLLQNLKSKNEGTVEPNVTIKGVVIIGKGTVIKSNSYIEGPVVIGENCTIGPNCYLRPNTSVGNNCKIGFEVEIKDSIFMNNSHNHHLSYIGDSIIGENVNIGAGTITGNLRHDRGLIRTMLNNELVDTGKEKLGVIIGDGAKLGIRTVLYPGRKIGPGKTTLPGEIVKVDIE